MKKLKICKNEFGVYYIADTDGVVQYKDGVILACCDKIVMRSVLKKLKQGKSLEKIKIAIQTANDANALKNKKSGFGYEIFDKEFKDTLHADFALDKDVKNILFKKIEKEIIEKNLFRQELEIRGLKYFFTWDYNKNNVIVNYYNERQA